MSPPRIASNAISLFLAYLLPRVLTFGAVVLAARVLGTAAFGQYGTAASLAVVLSVLATLGMPPLLIRDMARQPGRAPELLRAAHVTKTAASALMLACLVAIGSWILDYPRPVLHAAILLGLSYAIMAYVDNFAAYFQAVERMEVWMQASTLAGFVTGALGAAVIVATSSLTLFCAAPILGQLAALAWIAHRTPPAVRRLAPVPWSATAGLLRQLGPFVVSAIAVAAYYKIDILLLTDLRPPHEVGLYAAGRKFIDVAHALILVGVGAIFPRLARETAAAVGGLLLNLAVLAAAPAAVLLAVLRGPAVLLLFGAAYQEAARSLGLLAVAVPALAVNLLATSLLAARGRMGIVAGGYAAALATLSALNLLLIPRFGGVGAAAAFAVSETLLAFGFLVALKVTALAIPGRRPAAVAIVSSGLGVGAVFGLGHVPALPVAAALVLAMLALYWRAGAFRGAEAAAVVKVVRGAVRSRTAARPGMP